MGDVIELKHFKCLLGGSPLTYAAPELKLEAPPPVLTLPPSFDCFLAQGDFMCAVTDMQALIQRIPDLELEKLSIFLADAMQILSDSLLEESRKRRQIKGI